MSQEKPTADELAALSKPVYAPRRQRRKPHDANQGDLFADGVRNAPALEKNSVERPAAGAARSAAPGSEHRTAAAAGGDGPLYLSYGQCSDTGWEDDIPVSVGRVYGAEELGETVGTAYVVRACRCRRWFCEGCGPRRGYELRKQLSARLLKFRSVFGITLTVDGELFQSPEAAWLYFSKGGLIGRFVRDLDRRGHLHSKAYFWVVEFQKDTQQPHWHLLLDSSGIPYGEIVEIYSRYRPSDATPLAEPITAENYKGRAPGFGSVYFSPPADPLRAAGYVTKYLTKFPKHGFPDWVLDRTGRVPRFNHSRGFFPRIPKHEGMCFCDECRGEVESLPKTREKRVPKKKQSEREQQAPSRPVTSIRERIEKCRKTSTIVEVNQVRLPDGTVVDGRGRFVATIALEYAAACEFAGQSPDDARQLVVDWETADALVKHARGDDRGAAA